MAALVYQADGAGTATVTYVGATGAQEQHVVQLPWRLVLTQAPAPATLTVQHPSQGAASFSCTIIRFGSVAAHSEASGLTAVVRCSVN